MEQAAAIIGDQFGAFDRLFQIEVRFLLQPEGGLVERRWIPQVAEDPVADELQEIVVP